MLAFFCIITMVTDPPTEPLRFVETEPSIVTSQNDVDRQSFQSERFAQQQGMSVMGGPLQGNPQRGSPGYTLRFMPEQQLDNQPGELGFLRQQLQFAFPVWRDDKSMVMISTGVEHLDFQGSAMFPSGRVMPDQLWNLRMGPGYFRQLGEGWKLGLMSSVNVSGDKPFQETRDVNANFIGFLRVPSGETDAWMFSLFYAPLGELPFPLPGIAYQWQASETLSMNLGVPFSINYRPTECWSIDFNWMPVRTFRLQTQYQLTDDLSLFGRWQWTNDSYYLSDRSDDRERLFYYEMSLLGGVRYQLSDRVFAELGAGYAFDRYYFNGRKFDDRENDRIGLAPGAVVQAGINLRF
jgi:hypothetical protein